MNYPAKIATCCAVPANGGRYIFPEWRTAKGVKYYEMLDTLIQDEAEHFPQNYSLQ